MVELFASRRRAEELARALEGGQAIDARLHDLLQTASRLAAVPLVEPRAEFRDSLRERLMEAAAAELPEQAAQARAAQSEQAGPRHLVTNDAVATRRRRRLVAAATGLVLVGGATGVAAASEQALPGDVLYPVKRTIESAEVSLAQGDTAEGQALLERATTRLDEAQVLGSETAPTSAELDSVAATLDDFTADASAGGDRLLESYAQDGDPGDLQTLRDFTAEAHGVLADLAETLPPQARGAVVEADLTVVDLSDRAFEACPDCASGEPQLSPLAGQEVVLPPVGDDGSPLAGGGDPLTLPDRNGPDRSGGPATGQGDGDGTQTGSGRDGAEQDDILLPDLDLLEPRQGQRDQSPTSGSDGDGQTGPRLGDLGELLDPSAPSGPSRPTNGPDVGDVTDPLTEPLRKSLKDSPTQDPLSPVDPLLDGTGDTVDGTTDGLQDGPGGLL